jgi:hypothetical protein
LEDKNLDDVPIRIGHIASLDTREGSIFLKAFVDRCSGVRKCNLVVEANLMSNMFLQGSDSKALLTNIHNLLEKGIPVLPGSDGQGIISNSQIRETLQQLESKYGNDPLFKTVGDYLRGTSEGSVTSGAALRQKYLDNLSTNIAAQLCH